MQVEKAINNISVFGLVLISVFISAISWLKDQKVLILVLSICGLVVFTAIFAFSTYVLVYLYSMVIFYFEELKGLSSLE